MLEFDEVSRSFGSVEAVRQVSLSVQPGSVVAMIGHNGAGKSTLLRMAMGLERPDRGEVRIDGVPIDRHGSFAGVIGASLDAAALPASWSVATATRITAELAGVPAERVADVVSLVGLEQARARLVKNLSTGMRQRLAIGIALLGQPRLLVLDEPSTALDPVAAHDLRGWIREHAERGNSVLVASHNLQEIEEVADQVVVLQHGRVIEDAAKDDLLAPLTAVVRVDWPEVLIDRLHELSHRCQELPDGTLRVMGTTAGELGEICAQLGLVVRQLTDEQRRLTDVYQLLTMQGAPS
jgi:ABC-2 type transport system ATP-binding protein